MTLSSFLGLQSPPRPDRMGIGCASTCYTRSRNNKRMVRKVCNTRKIERGGRRYKREKARQIENESKTDRERVHEMERK